MPTSHTTFCLVLVVVLLGTSTSAMSQTPPRAAVVALDEPSVNRGLDAEAARVLGPTQMTVLQGDELDAWIAGRREPEPTAEVLQQFAPATQTIAEGVERFFYMSPDRALPSIEPVLDLAWNHPAVLAYRPDLADQIWQAGIVLVRAYAETRGPEEAQRQAERLLTLLPSRETDPKVVPPKTREILEGARRNLARGGATLRLSAPDPEHCTLYLNGAPAQPQKDYVVDPNGSYFARSDCSMPATPPTWRVEVAKGQAVEVLVPPIDPQRFQPADLLSDDGRRMVEWYLRATARLADADLTVGVASPSDQDAVILVRYDRESQKITWSDSDYTDSIRRGMPRIFPEYASLFDDAAEPTPVASLMPPPRQHLDWPGVALVSAGIVSTGVGTILVVRASRQSRLLDCAVNNPSPPSDRDCAGLRDDIYFDDFTLETRRVASVRTGGFVLVGVGVLAVGYGIFRLVHRPHRAEVAHLQWTPAGVQVRW